MKLLNIWVERFVEIGHNRVMKKFIFILSLCLFIPVSALGYQDYNNYTVIDRNNNTSGFVQRQGNSYYSSNSSTYSPQKNSMYYGNFNSFQKQNNVIQEVNGKRYIQQGNLIFED